MNICLADVTPDAVKPVFCGASLCALSKKGGGVRPIAVGCTWRRLVAKAACRAVMSKVTGMLSPTQIGFGIRRAAEAAAHAARIYVASLQPGQAFLKLDFVNAFNTISRDAILNYVATDLPEILNFVKLCYDQSSPLCFGDYTLLSDEGAQQGDPLGPLLFCLTTKRLTRNISSELNLWYLDDGSVGGDIDVLIRDFQTVRQQAAELGLIINEAKCELICDDSEVVKQFHEVAPNVVNVRCENAMLLGAPIGNSACVDAVLMQKLDEFKRLQHRLKLLNVHDAFYLIRNCFSLPKLLYTLRSAPCFASTELVHYDTLIRQTLQQILNIQFGDETWQQSTLPVSLGGLGVRSATDLALPTFLASVTASADFISQLLPSRLRHVTDPAVISAQNAWTSLSHVPCPFPPFSSAQKSWDWPLLKLKFDNVMSAAQSPVGRARLLAVTSPHSGDFLNAIPCSSVGTRLDNSSFRIATALRLSAVANAPAPICAPHQCVCGENVDQYGVHVHLPAVCRSAFATQRRQ